MAIIEELQEFRGPNYSVLGVNKMFRSDIRIVGPVTSDLGLSLHSVRTDYTSKAVSFRDNLLLDLCKWSLAFQFPKLDSDKCSVVYKYSSYIPFIIFMHYEIQQKFRVKIIHLCNNIQTYSLMVINGRQNVFQ